MSLNLVGNKLLSSAAVCHILNRVSDPDGVDPDPTFDKKLDPDPTLEKNGSGS